MSKNKGSNQENFEKTSLKFLEIAKKEFIEYGYTNASTERIVQESGMARGSLYYHYGNKLGIFKAVYKDITDESAARIKIHLDKIKDPFEALKEGCRLFFEECKNPDIRVVMLTEGISHIPYKERIKILEENLIMLMRDLIEGVNNQGKFKDYDPSIILMFIYGIMAECGRSFEYFGQLDNVDERIALYNKNLVILLNKIAD